MSDVPRLPAVTDPTRLELLRSTGLLDTPPEERFDRITRLAQRLLDVPVALISLVDEDRQYFKSHLGLKDEWATRGETPLSHSFCQYAVAMDAPLVVEDAREDPLLRRNGAIDDLDVVSYAGMPLRVTGGVLGTLCVIDDEPREWHEDELAALQDLTGLLAGEIEHRLQGTVVREVQELTDAVRAPARELADVLQAVADLGQGSTEPRVVRAAMVARRHLTTFEGLATRLRQAARAGEATAAETADVARRLRRAVEVATAVSGSDQLLLEIEGDVFPVACRPLELEQALSALVLSCLHHTDPQGHIEVRLHRRDDSAVLTVECPGTAIPIADVTRVSGRLHGATAQQEPGGGTSVRSVAGRTEVEAGSVRAVITPDGSTLYMEFELAG